MSSSINSTLFKKFSYNKRNIVIYFFETMRSSEIKELIFYVLQTNQSHTDFNIKNQNFDTLIPASIKKTFLFIYIFCLQLSVIK